MFETQPKNQVKKFSKAKARSGQNQLRPLNPQQKNNSLRRTASGSFSLGRKH